MVCSLATGLSKRGISVDVISLDDPAAQCFYELPTGATWHKLGKSGKLSRTWSLISILKRTRTHALIGFVMSGDKTIYTATLLARVKIIAAERNAPSMYWIRYHWFQRWMNFALLHLSNRILVQQASFIAGYPATLKGRMSCIANPVESVRTSARPAEPGANGRFMALAVSRLDPVQKRLHVLLTAFSTIASRFPDWDLCILGSGPDHARLSSEITNLGLSNRIALRPAANDVAPYYDAAHLFVMPSLWEGFPNALAEAMSHGLPAVGFSGASGVAELIGEGGWLADGVDDANALSVALSSAMSDAHERKQRGRHALASMRQFDPEIVFDQWKVMLTEVLRSP